MKYGLIGEKLSHSYSKIIHEKLGNKDYILKEIPRDKLHDFMTNRNFKGINVTIPYKKEVLPYLDFVSKEAREIGSVNTIVNKDGVLYGYNTDYFGFSIMARKAGISFKGKKVVILGSGGTSLTALAVAKNEGAKDIVVISRNGKNNYQNLYLHYDCDIIVNTTPVGMYPDTEKCPVDISGFKNLCGVIDVIYNPMKTNLLYQANSRNIISVCGLSMLVYQALFAHNLFFEDNISEDVAQNVLKSLEFETRNILLIGMPGCGKTTVGRILADKCGKKFIDIDEMIIKKTNMSIPEIFKEKGEGYFREVESSCLQEVGKEKGMIISTGGGIIKDFRNIYFMKQNSVVVYLTRSIDKLSTAGRPLSSSQDAIVGLYNERLPLYKNASDLEISNESTTELCADSIINELKKGII